MKILISYDPPLANSNLLDRVIAEATRQDVYVYLVTTLYDGREATPKEVEKAEQELSMAQSTLTAANIPSEQHILVRNLTPGEAITTFAQENEVDEIYIQIKKLSRVGKVLTGSNAQYIILNADCPVVSLK